MHEAGDNTMRVLVAEDEEILAEPVATGLRRAGFAVDTVYSGDAALACLGLHDYDVVVLDRDLPRVHGDDVARRLVSTGSRTRILMLTASGTTEDRVEGLGLPGTGGTWTCGRKKVHRAAAAARGRRRHGWPRGT